MRNHSVRRWVIRGILSAVFSIMVFPLFMLLVNSLMGKQELLKTFGAVLADSGEYAGMRIFPAYPTLRAYVRLLLDSPEYFTAFWNSMIQTAGVIFGQLLTAVPAAWAFAQFHFPGKRILWLVYMILMILPFQVTMVSGYLVLNAAGLMDTRAAVILPGIFSTLPVFILRKTFAGIPGEILEAARIDGAGDLRIFFGIGIPLGVPGIFSVITKSLWPLSLYLPQMIGSETAAAFAASIVTLLPAVLLFFWGQAYLEQGIAASGRL